MTSPRLKLITITNRQELDRMQCVIKQVRESLCDLKLAIDGTIVMSQFLRESLDAMYDARIPDKWMKVSGYSLFVDLFFEKVFMFTAQISWESTTLGFWYTELLERNTQFRTWFLTDRPKVSFIQSYSKHPPSIRKNTMKTTPAFDRSSG